MKKRFLMVTIFSALTMLLAPSPAERRMNILVYPFSNAGSPQHSWISPGMTDTVIADLMRLKSVNIFSDDDRKKAVREIELGMTGLVRESDIPGVGKIMGANLIFTGSYTVTGRSVRVVAKLIDVETTKVRKSRKIDGTLDAIGELEDRIVVSLMEEAEGLSIRGVSVPKFTAGEKREAGKGYTPTGRGFELYSRAMEISERNPREALNLATQALGADPGYPGALILAGSLSSSLGDIDGASRYYMRAKNALENTGLCESADYALLVQNIALTAWNRGDNTAAIENNLIAKRIWDNLESKDSPAYASMLVVLGAAYRQQGDNRKGLEVTLNARETLERAGLKKSSPYAWTLSNLGVIRQNLGEYQKTIDLYHEANRTWESLNMKKSMGYAFTYSQIGGAYYMKGEYRAPSITTVTASRQCESLGLQGPSSMLTTPGPRRTVTG